MSRVARVGALCVVALTALALHGCTGDLDEATATQDGATFEEATQAELSSTQVDEVKNAATELAADHTSQEKLQKFIDAFTAILGDVLDATTSSADAAIENDHLVVKLVLKPIVLANGLLQLTRTEDDYSGPIFHFKVPVANNVADVSALGAQLMKSGAIHIEGFLRAFPFTEGGFKLTTEEPGKKFELFLQEVKFFNLISVQCTLSVADDNKVTAVGSAQNWFDEEMAKKVVDTITQLAEDLIKQLQDALAAQGLDANNFDPDCSNLFDASCVKSKAVYEIIKLVTDDNTVNAITALVRGAAQAVTDMINAIFKIKKADFNLAMDPDDKTGTLELNLEATVFGIDVGPHNIVVDTNDIEGFVDKIIQQFAPLIHALKTRRV